jgi:hypothetical protein
MWARVGRKKRKIKDKNVKNNKVKMRGQEIKLTNVTFLHVIFNNIHPLSVKF